MKKFLLTNSNKLNSLLNNYKINKRFLYLKRANVKNHKINSFY